MKIAILGFGIVGSGVAELLTGNTEQISLAADQQVELKYILDIQSFPDSPFADKFVQDFSTIEQDRSVRAVVETIGGVGAAYDFTKRALLAGKSVITSNKELVASHGYELLTLAKEQNVNYLFEASVGGGIPIIRPICQCLSANEISEVCGILNGTTNFMLTEMVRKNVSFDAALADAQARGYAEADPAADIDGDDACRKICILGSLSFGRHIDPEQVPADGIRNVTLQDVAYARSASKKIKLLARAMRLPDGRVAAYVSPHLIPKMSILSNVEDVFNGIVVKGNAIGDVMFYGPGAGKFPTASAVVADVIDCAKHLDARKHMVWNEGGPDTFADPAAIPSRWYVRTPAGGERCFYPLPLVLLTYPGSDPTESAFLTEPISQTDLAPMLEQAGAYCAFRILD
ncbi:MAG: homoserine dehydrogenase [Oscillospiraceae bacterium]|nr:homoserine dehydrogenase [Oscillospiraceae bacterium]